MKKKERKLKSDKYILLLESYTAWLSLLGYAQSSVLGFRLYMREFLYWLEQLGLLKIEEVGQQECSMYMEWLSQRDKRKYGIWQGNLSNAYLNGSVRSLKKLEEYLLEVKGLDLDLSMRYRKDENLFMREILKEEEIILLYENCAHNFIGIRNRAMLGVYYGCGLRRSEGEGLLVSDILLEKALLKVRKSKTYRQRYVPIAINVVEDFKLYLFHRGSQILENKSVRNFFISERGKAIQGQNMNVQFKKLLKISGIERSLSLHSLRHSIATHLLWRGFRLEEVGKFLGHVSLNSTQLYTRLKKE